MHMTEPDRTDEGMQRRAREHSTHWGSSGSGGVINMLVAFAKAELARAASQAPDTGAGTSCICCANGNDLPDGEHCRACGRKGMAVGLRAAVIIARGRYEPPTVPVKFAAPPKPAPDKKED